MIVSVNKLLLFIWQALKKFFENVLQVSSNEKYTVYPANKYFHRNTAKSIQISFLRPDKRYTFTGCREAYRF